MNPAVRILEEWTTHQDYFWFVAVLAWAGVLTAELPRRRTARSGWLVALAASSMGGAVLELVLLAQHLNTPYTRLDVALGLLQATGTAALVWRWFADSKRAGWWMAAAVVALGAAAIARLNAPLGGGVVLTVIHGVAVISVWRSPGRPLPAAAALLVGVMPIMATHGPVAYAWNEGRRHVDWSHFALVAAGVSIAAGAVLAASAWRRRLESATRESVAGGTLRRDLRWAVIVLAVWMGGGGLLAVWYGRIARRAFEENLLRRVDTAVLALDERSVAEALGPELKITATEQQTYPDGRRVTVATAPHTRAPVYATLRAQMARIRENNPDFKFLYIATWRSGMMLVLNSHPRRGDAIKHVIHHAITPADLERLAARRSFLEGPVTSEGWLPQFSAKAALRDPGSGRLLGWLVADIEATRWMTTFVQARLQTMALVGAGVGLWTLAVAYRLRREAREAAEQRAAAAAAADRMKSAFLAKVSHELRTPIQSVLGYGELLENAPLSEMQRGWLTALRSHGDIMLRLVNDLIDLGARQSGAFQLQHGPVALRALIGECEAALRPALDAKGLAFRSEIDASAPPWVRTDGVRLRQILLNLLTNAVKFTSSGGVVLTVRREADGTVEMIVKDTGPGIPAGLRSRLFQPFARLDPAAGGGSGLGLALVQGICMAMGGSVRHADSGQGGAMFVVRLPLTPCEPRKATGTTDAGDAAPNFAGLRILLAEDNTLVRELIATFLKRHGAEVSIATDGPAALALAGEGKPDVVLLDIALPGMDGIAVAETLRRDGSRVRIIGLSAHVAAHEQARAREAGMDLFLAKPVRLAQLGEAIVAQMRASKEDGIGRSIADPALRAKLLSQFADETPAVLAEMRGAFATANWARLRSRAHYLKNSADVLGAAELQAACQQLAVLDDALAPAEARTLLERVELTIASPLASVERANADGG